MAQERILIVDDEEIVRLSLCELLRDEGYEVDAAAGGSEALDAMAKARYSLVIADVSMPGMSGIDILREVKKTYDGVEVILITGYGNIKDAVGAMKLGAYEYVGKPIIDDEIKLLVRHALDEQSLRRENEALKEQLELRSSFHTLIGRDHQMQQIYKLVETVADTRTTILITGETGTGKSRIARTIHHVSSQRSAPFIEVNCGAIPETLLESELFGHKEGSFTGAIRDKAGKFELAAGGTIFLDEIASASPLCQMKLLRVLQDKQFEAVGGEETRTVDIRVILATNVDLMQKVKEGAFREDLYYRIHVVTIDVPPLRERLGDLRELADHFLRSYAKELGKDLEGIEGSAVAVLQRYPWPGNVRELENVIQRACILAQSRYVQLADLPPQVLESASPDEDGPQSLLPLREALGQAEERIIRKYLGINDGNRQQTAEMLGINRTTLFNKMRKFGLLEEF